MSDNTLQMWAIVEVMGHKKYAGYVTEQVIGSAALIRVDVPETNQGDQGMTGRYSKLIGPSVIYCITPCTEELACAAAQHLEQWNNPIPVDISRPLLPTMVASTAEVVDDDDNDDDDRTWRDEYGHEQRYG